MKFVWISLLSSFFCLDAMAAAQVMISRPIVVGMIIGYLMGDLKAGIYIGAIIELVWIAVIPVGLAVPPDVTISAALASVWYLAAPGKCGMCMIAAIAAAIPAGMLFKKFDILHRQVNIRLAKLVDKRLEAGDESIITKVSLLGVCLFFLKAFVFLVITMPLGAYALSLLGAAVGASSIAAPVKMSADFALGLAPAVGMGVLYGTFRKKYEKA